MAKPTARAWLAAAIALMTMAPQALCANLDVQVRGESGEPVVEAVVVAVPRFPHRAPPPKADAVEQIGREFVPHVKVVLVGTPVAFPNRDEVKHHVYSFSPARKFEIELYKGTPSAPIVFDQPGEVVLGCNIHDWMAGYVYVSESPFFAKTDERGNAQITGLPAGNYSVRVWHPGLPVGEHQTQRTISVADSTIATRWELKVRPEARIRRAPATGGGAYR